MVSLNRVTAPIYVSEVGDLLAVLLNRLDAIQRSQASWLVAEKLLVAELQLAKEAFSHKRYEDARDGRAASQAEIFLEIDGVMAAWARLSLLLFPNKGTGSDARWRKVRGEQLREILLVPAGSLLANRTVRDAWMHFDERLDCAVINGWLGGRQTLCGTARVADAVKRSVRVLDLQSLTFHYRTSKDEHASVALSDMRKSLLEVERGLMGAGERLAGRVPVGPR